MKLYPYRSEDARGVRSASSGLRWRPVTQGEAVVACVVDLLVLLGVALAVGLVREGALWWILTLEIAVAQGLFLARTGRTIGLWLISATAVVPRRGTAPGIYRASGRIVLHLLLPIRTKKGPGGRGSEFGDLLLDRVTGTLTLTQRSSPEMKKKENPWLAAAGGSQGRPVIPGRAAR